MSRATFTVAAVLVAAVAGRSTPLMAVLGPPLPAGIPAAAPQELPDGPGKEELSKLCSGCHDLMFTVSTRETKEGWTRIVNDMRSKGADGSDEDFAKVIEYLTAHMGKPGHGARSVSIP